MRWSLWSLLSEAIRCLCNSLEKHEFIQLNLFYSQSSPTGDWGNKTLQEWDSGLDSSNQPREVLVELLVGSTLAFESTVGPAEPPGDVTELCRSIRTIYSQSIPRLLSLTHHIIPRPWAPDQPKQYLLPAVSVNTCERINRAISGSNDYLLSVMRCDKKTKVQN